MNIVFTLLGFFCLLGAFIALSVLKDVFVGASKIRSQLLEFKDAENKRLRPTVSSPRTGRLTGGLTPGKGMTYVPSDDLVDSI